MADPIGRSSREARPSAWAEIDAGRARGFPAADELAAAMLAGGLRLVLALLAALRDLFAEGVPA